jgi:hypothetical protein
VKNAILSLQNQAAERENGKKTCITRSDISSSFSRVERGLEFILSHFREPLFPRKVSTAATENKQETVNDRDTAMLSYYKAALWENCRIAGYGLNQANPDLIFIDLDAPDFVTLRSFKLALTTTLKTIKKKIGGHPTMLWSGRGYHIIQPIDCPVNLDNVKEFAAITNTPNNKFLQFAERHLSNGKADSSNNPAIRSCMLRVPGSLNSKCKAAGTDPEVKIIQKWDGYRPDYRLFIGSFYADLVDQYYKQRQQRWKKLSKQFQPQQKYDNSRSSTGIPEPYIDKLLQTPIEDYRKHGRDLILVPYLVVRRGMTDPDKIYGIVMQWADKCAELKRLEPSRHEFAARLTSRIYEVMQNRVPHMQLQTLKEKNPDLYETLKLSDAD